MGRTRRRLLYGGATSGDAVYAAVAGGGFYNGPVDGNGRPYGRPRNPDRGRGPVPADSPPARLPSMDYTQLLDAESAALRRSLVAADPAALTDRIRQETAAFVAATGCSPKRLKNRNLSRLLGC